MSLITVRELRIGFRGPLLLDGVSCQIESGQRIGLLGRNGAVKTMFLRILSGQVDPDGGQVGFAPGATVSLLPQEVPQHLTGTIQAVVAQGPPSPRTTKRPGKPSGGSSEFWPTCNWRPTPALNPLLPE